jgi:histidine triad (HIT) family protein
MPSLFTKIITGQIPSYKIYEDDLVFVFLDIFPIATGHTLIVPKVEVDYWLDLPQNYYEAVFAVAPKIAKAITTSLVQINNSKPRIGQVIDGREVPHCHLHLVPIVEGRKINEKSIPTPTEAEFISLQKLIISNL